jgi:hypothetical protein
MNIVYKKRQKVIRHPMYKVRQPHRRTSDGLIKVMFNIEEQHIDLEKMIEKKKAIKED